MSPTKNVVLTSSLLHPASQCELVRIQQFTLAIQPVFSGVFDSMCEGGQAHTVIIEEGEMHEQ